MDVVLSLPKGRVRVKMLYQAYQKAGYGYGCRTEPTKGSGTYMDVVPSLSKGRVREKMLYQAYRKVGYGYGCFTKLTKGSGMVRLLVPVPVPAPRCFDEVVPSTMVFPAGVSNFLKCRVGLGMAYRAL